MRPLTNETFRRHGVPADASLYTVAEVARLVRVAVPTVYRWIEDGKLASIRLNIRGAQRPPIRIPRAAVLRLIEGDREARLEQLDREARALLEGEPGLAERTGAYLAAHPANDDGER